MSRWQTGGWFWIGVLIFFTIRRVLKYIEQFDISMHILFWACFVLYVVANIISWFGGGE